MKQQNVKNNISKSLKLGLLAGLVITIFSFLIKLVPCIKKSGFNFCTLPSPFKNLESLNEKYYGISNNPLSGLLLQFIIPSILVFFIIFSIGKKLRSNN
ncbi:MAG: hypothetical protein QXW97_00175 [Candidatus Pacearchaeota archaeon]